MSGSEDANGRFVRLMEGIVDEDGTGGAATLLEKDVQGRTFVYCSSKFTEPGGLRRVAITEGRLRVEVGIGELASGAWGHALSDEDGWFRLSLALWDEMVGSQGPSASGWWTFGASGVYPLPPWEARQFMGRND